MKHSSINTDARQWPAETRNSEMGIFTLSTLKNAALSPWARLTAILVALHPDNSLGRDDISRLLGCSISTSDRAIADLLTNRIATRSDNGCLVLNNRYPSTETRVSCTAESATRNDGISRAHAYTRTRDVNVNNVNRVTHRNDIYHEEDILNTSGDNNTRAREIAVWFAKRIAGVVPRQGSNAWTAAEALARAGVSDADLDAVANWLQAEPWVHWLSLPLIASQYNNWKTRHAAHPPISQVLRSRLDLLVTGQSDPSVFSGMDLIKYVTGAGAADNLAADIAYLESLIARENAR